MPTFSSCTKCLGTIHDNTPGWYQLPWHGCTDGLTFEHDFDSQATGVIDVLGLYSAMLSTGVYTTRHWQTTGRLLQELNVCSVVSLGKIYDRRPDCHPVAWAWMTLQLNVAFDLESHVICGCMYNKGLADVRSTGAGINCLYCSRYLVGKYLTIWYSHVLSLSVEGNANTKTMLPI